MSIETAGVEDLVMLDGTPDESALDSVLLPEPRVEKKPRATPSQPHVPVKVRGDGTRSAEPSRTVDLNFSPPVDQTPPPSAVCVVPDLNGVPEARTMPLPDAAEGLADVPEAGVLPEMGPQSGPSTTPDAPLDRPGDGDSPAATAAGMGFTAVEAVDEPEENHAGEEQPGRSFARQPIPHTWILIFGIICGIVAVVGMIWTRS